MVELVSNGYMYRAVAPAGGVITKVPVLIGSLFVIPSTSADAGEPFEGHLHGEWNITKNTADVVAAGADAYWDDGNDRVTTTVGSNTKIGVFTEARANGDTKAYVRLNGIGV